VVYKKAVVRADGAYPGNHSAFICSMDRKGWYLTPFPHQISGKVLRAALEGEMSRLEATAE
jgi:hypothetical protein